MNYARTSTRGPDSEGRWQCDSCGGWCDPEDREDGSSTCPVCAEEAEDEEEDAEDEEADDD